MPSDAQRIQTVKFLLDEGYLDRVVISHDIHTKHRLVSSALLNSLYTVGLFEKRPSLDRLLVIMQVKCFGITYKAIV